MMPSDAHPLLAGDSCQQAMKHFSWSALWSIFDGTPERMNLAAECLDRHRGMGTAVSLKFDDGHAEHYTFEELSDDTSRFARWLERRGIAAGDRVAVMLEPSRAFYVSLFGAVKRGAIAVPLFTLFGPDALRLRLDDCTPAMVIAQGDKAALVRAGWPAVQVVEPDEAFWSAIGAEDAAYSPATRAADPAIFQYTSGTTRELPEAVRHSHRSVVTLMVAALYGVGLKPGDRYFCPSSPAWGHGLWHGTIAPLALGIHIGAYSGRFDAQRIFEALQDFRIDNLAAAPTVFRMLRSAAVRERYEIALRKLSYTGEPMDPATAEWIESAFGVPACSMYGSTEVGVLIVNYPGFSDYRVKRGALGKPVPGLEVAVVDSAGRILAPGETGEIAVRRKDGWFFVKDRGRVDEEGYFHIEGRSDDVIISAGWTMSAVEIENTLLRHPAVLEAAVVGVPDAVRGQIAKAFIVPRELRDDLIEDIQRFMQAQLSRHEYPRSIEFLAELPKTPAGKTHRKALRERSSR
jgi:acetyl-CoA synthetase